MACSEQVLFHSLHACMAKLKAQDLYEGLPLRSYLSVVRHANKPLFGLPVLIQFQGHICSVRWPLAVKGAQCHQKRNKGNVMRSIENELSDKKGREKKKQNKPKMLAVLLHG